MVNIQIHRMRRRTRSRRTSTPIPPPPSQHNGKLPLDLSPAFELGLDLNAETRSLSSIDSDGLENDAARPCRVTSQTHLPLEVETIDNPDYTFSEEDAIILLMGPSGSGKSTFINNYLGQEIAQVHTELEVVNNGLGVYKTPIPSNFPPSKKKNLVFVDTPGLFSGQGLDYEIFNSITQWLRPENSGRHKHLTGVIYVHDVTQKRMVREMQMPLSLFQKMCGKDACPKTVLLTTQWPDASNQKNLSEASKRNESLEGEFFAEMTKAGATNMALNNGKREQDVIRFIVGNAVAQDIILLIQKELEEGKLLAQTVAGQQLRKCLQELLMSFRDSAASDREQVSAIMNGIKQLSMNPPSRRQRFSDWFRLNLDRARSATRKQTT